jgi:hypothetical protein
VGAGEPAVLLLIMHMSTLCYFERGQQPTVRAWLFLFLINWYCHDDPDHERVRFRGPCLLTVWVVICSAIRIRISRSFIKLQRK